VKVAERYVRDYGIAPPRELEMLKVTRLNVASVSSDVGEANQRVVDVGVAFQRRIGGVPVDGPGGKVVVYLNHNAELTGFDRIWRDVAHVHRPVEALISPADAAAQMERYWRGEEGLIQIREVRFGYFELGPQQAQRYIQPAYVMLLRFVSPDDRIRMNSAFVMAAATNPVGRLMPRLKKPVLQDPRSAD
jgi:hypothetical protein